MAQVYMNWDRWVVDCEGGCGSAYKVEPDQSSLVCDALGGCGVFMRLDWPHNREALETELRRRPLESTRNWFPSEHPLAVMNNRPHGQSVKDLVEEFEMETPPSTLDLTPEPERGTPNAVDTTDDSRS